MKYAIQIRQMAKRMGVQQKIDKLYELTANEINLSYNLVKKEFNELEVELNNVLANNMADDNETKKVCEHYIYINEILITMFDLTCRIESKFKTEIDEISEIYIRATCMFCEGGLKEAIGKSYCFISAFRNNFCQWVEDFIYINVEEISHIHKAMGEGLEYVFTNISDNENEELNEVRNEIRQIRYVASSKELEDMAITNGYRYKSQCGSHKKYENERTNKCVIIPSHNRDLGNGISYVIQKQILANAI